MVVPQHTGGPAGPLGDDAKRPARHETGVAEPGQALRVGIGEANDLVLSGPRLGEPGRVERAAGAFDAVPGLTPGIVEKVRATLPQ